MPFSIKSHILTETPSADFKLSPAYDLLNSRIRIDDKDFSLEQGLIPEKFKKSGITGHFHILGELGGLSKKHIEQILKQ